MKESQTTYELFYTSEKDSWEPAAEAFWNRSEAEAALIRLKRIEPSAYIVRTVRTRSAIATGAKQGNKK